MRLFIATPVTLPIYEAIKRNLSKYVEGKWVEGWNLHLTHKFIGNDSPKKYEIPLNIPEEEIKIGKMGVMNNRILYLKADSPHIDSINKQINEKFGFKEERKFLPHVTLCRIKKIKDEKFFDEIKRWKEINLKIPFEVYLYCSKLTKKGPIYEKIHKY
jgi:2'-5' RNA ligase